MIRNLALITVLWIVWATLTGCSSTPNVEKVSPFSGPAVRGVSIALNEDATPTEGQPVTSIAVTQCSLLIAVYVTMPDGQLVRFDQDSQIAADQLLAMAYTAKTSERLELDCAGSSFQIERHSPT
jgi:hypothetical protein